MPTFRALPLTGSGLLAIVLAACGDPGGAGVFGNPGSGGADGDGGADEGGTRSGGPASTVATGTGGGAPSASASASTVTVGATSSVSSASGGCVPGVEVACANGTQCIPVTWQCDGFMDCTDGSDEAPINPACSSIVSSSASTGVCEIACGDGVECIFAADICDGQSDCNDGNDERGCDAGAWTCNADYYGTGDGCDCGCGTRDPDCTSAAASACDYCNGQGACSTQCSQIHAEQNWRCGGNG